MERKRKGERKIMCDQKEKERKKDNKWVKRERQRISRQKKKGKR